MRVVCLSDTHLTHELMRIDVPDGDLLLHAGDATNDGTEDELRVFLDWFAALPHRRKVLVAGNHDWIFQKDPARARRLLPASVLYLQDEAAEIDGLRLYGSPWQPAWFDWAFNLPRGEALERVWSRIPEGLDILLTHGPPAGILDLSWDKKHVGCADLLKAVERAAPRLHVFGHIHVSYGQFARGPTRFVNAAICDEALLPRHPAQVVDL